MGKNQHQNFDQVAESKNSEEIRCNGATSTTCPPILVVSMGNRKPFANAVPANFFGKIKKFRSIVSQAAAIRT
jgi:hypothetical protein